MGTRADFYIEEDSNLIWLGSIAWDGYTIDERRGEKDKAIMSSKTKDKYIMALKDFVDGRDDFTSPENGWPWPWEDSCTTDYAYIFHGNRVQSYSWGKTRKGMNEDGEYIGEEPQQPDWPNMKDIQNVDYGDRSGLLIISA